MILSDQAKANISRTIIEQAEAELFANRLAVLKAEAGVAALIEFVNMEPVADADDDASI